MSAQPADGSPAEAMDVLRAVWRAQGQTTEDLTGDPGEQKACKRMTDAGVGFDEFGAGEEDVAAGWRARLEREGKLNHDGGTVRDLVLPSSDAR